MEVMSVEGRKERPRVSSPDRATSTKARAEKTRRERTTTATSEYNAPLSLFYTRFIVVGKVSRGEAGSQRAISFGPFGS